MSTIKTCLNINCPERKSACCNAPSIPAKNDVGRGETNWLICSECKEQFISAKCTAGFSEIPCRCGKEGAQCMLHNPPFPIHENMHTTGYYEEIKETYNQHDHSHCFESPNPPCGQKIKHFSCCLCEKLNPEIDSILKSDREVFIERVISIIHSEIDEAAGYLTDKEFIACDDIGIKILKKLSLLQKKLTDNKHE